MGIVIYYKARPKFSKVQLDLLNTSQTHKKMFMPFPVWDAAAVRPSDYPRDLALAINRHIGCQEPTWLVSKCKLSARCSAVTNLIRRVDAATNDRWAIIPRLGNGECWIAQITSKYKSWSQKTSPWFSPLTSSLGSAGEPNPYECLADVAQGWETGNWKPVPFAYLPRWFSKQLLSQTSIGSVHPLKGYCQSCLSLPAPETVAADAYYGRLSLLLPSGAPSPNAPAVPQILARRLVERLSPTLFELLCVELLQAKFPQLGWIHVAGAGDGGADGVGYDLNGMQPPEILQAKWQIEPNTKIPPGTTVLAYLVGNPPTAFPNGPPRLVWGPAHIAQEVSKSWGSLSSVFRCALS